MSICGLDDYKNLIPVGRFLGSYNKKNGETIDIDLSEVIAGDSLFITINDNYSETSGIKSVKFPRPSRNRTAIVFKLFGYSHSNVIRPSSFYDKNFLTNIYTSVIYTGENNSLSLYTATYRDESDEFMYVNAGMRFLVFFIN